MNSAFRRLLLSVLCSVAMPLAAHAQLRICSWNVTNYTSNGTAPSNSRDASFQLAFYGVIPSGLAMQGRSMSPDVIIGQEFISQTAVNTFRNLLNSAAGSPGDWASAPFLDGPDTDSAFFYRTSKVQYIATWTVALGASGNNCEQPRHTRRYDFRPIGYSSAPATLAAYSVHLKAQGSDAACPAGENAEGRRLLECTRIRDNAQGADTNVNWTAGNGGSNPAGSSALPAGYQFIMAGDTNIQNSARPDYQEMVGSQANNAGRFFDPIASPGTWNNANGFRFIHTQDPAGSGGMDDRHDQIIMGGGLLDSDGLSYIFVPGSGGAVQAFSTTTWNDPNHTYRCWGNDGTSFNLTLRTTGNTFVGPTIAQAIVTSANGGGHMPVMADFRVPAKASANATIAFGQVLQGSAATGTLTVSNGGNVSIWNIAGIDTLRYSLTSSSGFGAPAGQFVDIAGGGANAHSITMDTSTLGVKSGTITIASNDPDQPFVSVTLTGEVIPNTPVNTPPVANAGTDQFINNQSGSGSELVTLNGSLSHDNEGPIANYRWSEGASTLANGASPSPTVSLPVGTHSILLTVTDSGALTGTDTVVVTINGRPTANAGPDQLVNDADGNGSESVAVSGAASSDPDDGIVTYRWSEGPTTLAQGSSPTASLLLANGVHAVTLRVTDAHGAFNDDQVILTVNARPTANAGPDQLVNDADGNGSELVSVNGSGSTDPDGGIVDYRWSEGVTILAQGPSPTASFLLSTGVHTVTLRVTDANGAFSDDQVILTVNARPTANAGPDQTLTDTDNSGSEPVTLDGSASADIDGGIASYRWSEGATVLADSSSATAAVSLTVGVHTITLRATDTHGAFSEDDVLITVNAGTPPCPADFNHDGDVNPDDLGDFITCFFTEPPCPGADFNADGDVNPDDLGDYITTFFGPPC